MQKLFPKTWTSQAAAAQLKRLIGPEHFVRSVFRTVLAAVDHDITSRPWGPLLSDKLFTEPLAAPFLTTPLEDVANHFAVRVQRRNLVCRAPCLSDRLVPEPGAGD